MALRALWRHTSEMREVDEMWEASSTRSRATAPHRGPTVRDTTLPMVFPFMVVPCEAGSDSD
jgi:hypothetical protein